MPDPQPTPAAPAPAAPEPTPPASPDPKAGDPPKQDAPKADAPKPEDFKSEESKKAVLADLAKEREARKALEARFEKLGEAFGVQKPENGKTDVDQLTERLTKHEEAIATEREARWRAEVAHAKGMTPEQAAELRGKTREELEAHAERLKTLFPASATPGTPKPDLSQGARGQTDLDAQIAAAEQKGDVRESIRLKNQKAMAARAATQ